MAGTEAPDHQEHFFIFETRFKFIDNGIHCRLVLRDHLLAVLLDRFVKQGGNSAQALIRFGRSEEVVFHPRNTVSLLHMLNHVVHGTVAVNQVQLRLMGNFQLIQGTVTGPLGNDTEAHFFEQDT
ncbi:hypothetical protein D3C81_1754820 [compost metagenome]